MSTPNSVVVAGGGPVGAATALSLADRGFEVILVDRSRPQSGPSAFAMDIRNVALSPRSTELLQRVNAWPKRAAAYQKMRVWEEQGNKPRAHLHHTARPTCWPRQAADCFTRERRGTRTLDSSIPARQPAITRRISCTTDTQARRDGRCCLWAASAQDHIRL